MPPQLLLQLSTLPQLQLFMLPMLLPQLPMVLLLTPTELLSPLMNQLLLRPELLILMLLLMLDIKLIFMLPQFLVATRPIQDKPTNNTIK